MEPWKLLAPTTSYIQVKSKITFYGHPAQTALDNNVADTDSVIAIQRKGQPQIPTGDFIGDFQSELRPDEHIKYFACGGPKCYAYETNLKTQVFKAKGIRIDQGNKDIFRLQNLKRMVKDPSVKFQVYNPFFIHRPRGQYKLISRALSKTFQYTYDKRVVCDNYATEPHGFLDLQ